MKHKDNEYPTPLQQAQAHKNLRHWESCTEALREMPTKRKRGQLKKVVWVLTGFFPAPLFGNRYRPSSHGKPLKLWLNPPVGGRRLRSGRLIKKSFRSLGFLKRRQVE